MAVLAGIGGIYMGQVFTPGDGAVMTTGTAAEYFIVIYREFRAPGCDRVAAVAEQRGFDMGQVFAGRDAIVMTCDTFADDLRMIDIGDTGPIS